MLNVTPYHRSYQEKQSSNSKAHGFILAISVGIIRDHTLFAQESCAW